MKKNILGAMLFTFFVISCGKKEDTKVEEYSGNLSIEKPVVTTTEPPKDAITLIQYSDCLTCHKVDAKLVGPAYQEIAAKYENTPANIDLLADKILKGGSGNWGEVAMLPHPTITKDDAKMMAKYILSLKK